MKVITFGEIMLRLQPYNYERFVQCDHVEFTFGGGEANVSVSLANYGVDVSYVTKLPTHSIGQCAVNSLRRYGVDTSKIVRGGDRVGIYFNEKGASQRGSVCVYDRANSAIAKASREDFDWDSILRVQIGSTSQVSLPLWAEIWLKSARKLARQQRKEESRSPAT